MGQPSKDFALREERLASEKISEGRRGECATRSTGRIAQNPATVPTHQTRSDENVVKSMDRTGSAFKDLAEKFSRLNEAKIERWFMCVLRTQTLQRRYVQQRTAGRREKNLGHVSSGVN
jgi:hypothetical protein